MTARRDTVPLDEKTEASFDEQHRLLVREKGRRADVPVSREALWAALVLIEEHDRPAVSFVSEVVRTFVYQNALPRDLDDPAAIYEHTEIQMAAARESIADFLADPTVARRREALVSIQSLVAALLVLGGEVDSTEITE